MTSKPSDDESTPSKRKRGPRRATVAGTGPTTTDEPEPRLEDLRPKAEKPSQKKLSERDRWMLEEKPPHY